MQYRFSPLFLLVFVASIPSHPQVLPGTVHEPLVVPAGTPLRAYLTKRFSKRLGEPVEAKLLDSLYAFDREVVPAGSQILGTVVRLKPAPKMRRASAILNGDFTPYHDAEVQFNTLVMPDGRRISLSTVETPGLNSIADFSHKKKAAAANQNTGVLGAAKSQVRNQIDATRQSVDDIVRAPDKKERVEDFLWAKAPYHPQHVRQGTRFDAELAAPLHFGAATLKNDDLLLIGSQPPADASVQARLTTPLTSDATKPGDPVEAVLSQPLFSSDHKLVLPEGTRLTGAVTVAQRARWFHRGGKLRFSFDNISLPDSFERPGQPAPQPTTRTLATLKAAEPDGQNPVKVDDEGGVKAQESKTRFLAPAVAALIATKSADNDAGRHPGTVESNTAGRTLGGLSGLGLVGAAAAKTSPGVATALGFYGLGWSVFLHVVSRGQEVDFQKNAAIDIRFGARPAPAAGGHAPKTAALRTARQ